MYKRTVWKDHVVQFPDRFVETVNPDGSIEHVKAPGNTIQEGTNQDALHFNNLEEGVVCLATAFDLYYATTQAIIRDLDNRLAAAEAQLAIIP
jgi:hypothetical protein